MATQTVNQSVASAATTPAKARAKSRAKASLAHRAKWEHLDAKLSLIHLADLRRVEDAYTRPEHHGSRLHAGEGCMDVEGTLLYVLEDYRSHRWADQDGAVRDEVGYVVWHPKQGRVFAPAGRLWAQNGSVRHLQLVRTPVKAKTVSHA